MSLILLDTHVAVWGAAGELGTKPAKLIDDAALRGELLLSPISAWEIAMLVVKGRLVVGPPVQEFIRALFERSGAITAALTPAIAASAATLPGVFHGDPADRILVATAAAYGARLVTRDRRVLNYAELTKKFRCIPC